MHKLFTFICCLSTFYFAAQDTYVRPITFRDGLTTQSIYNLYVNHLGLLYLGTDKGLMAYDGIKFQEFQYQDCLSISANNIEQDYRGIIWCKNFSNEIFYLNNNLLKQEASIQQLMASDQTNLVGFTFLKNQMWIVTEKNIYVRIKNEPFIKVLGLNLDDLSESFTAISVDKKNQKIYVLSVKDAYIFKNHKIFKKKKIIEGQKEAIVYNDSLYFNLKGIKNEIYDASLNKIKDFNSKNIYYNKLSIADKSLWVCTAEGVYYLNNKNKSINLKYLANKNTTDIVEDKEHNLWISTLNEGLFMIPEKDIYHYKLKELPDNINYTSILKTEDNTYIGTSKGQLIRTDDSQKILSKFQFTTFSDVEFIRLLDDGIYSTFGAFSKDLKNIKIDRYLGKYIDKFDDNKYLKATYNSAGLVIDTINASKNELKKLQKKFKIEEYYKRFKYITFRNKRARCVLLDKKNSLHFVGFSDGLFIYDKDYNEQEIKFLNKPIIASRIVKDIFGDVWVSTSQNGIFRFKKNKINKHYSINDGLSSNQCKRLAVQNDGLWILTTNGINFLSFADYQVKNLNQSLNFAGIQINDFDVNNGQIYLATNSGVFHFSQNIFKKQTPASFFIKDVFVNNNRPKPNQKVFKHDENNFNFVFQSIHFKSFGDYNYVYRLKPINEKWESQKAINQEVKYLSLKPGNYIFEAKVDLKDGGSKILNYEFTIEKPFWLSWWFILLEIIFLSLAIYFIYKFITNRIRKQENIKLQFALSQLTALRSQMNPHFLFNILNAVQGLIYSNQKAKANEYLGTFSDLIRKTLDFSDQVEISLADELDATTLYIKLEQSRFEEGEFFYEFVMDKKIDAQQVLIPSLIIQPFVENAIKHGLMHKTGLKHLIFKIYKTSDYLHFLIDDNGIGRAASETLNKKMKKHQSFATQAIKNRIDLLNKISSKPISFEFIDKEQPETGTQVLLKIPIKEKTKQV